MGDNEIPPEPMRSRDDIRARQGEKLAALIAEIAGRNPFYTRKFKEAGVDPTGLHFPDDLARLPITTKAELVADQNDRPPWGTNLTWPLERYTRYHQTSSTTGSPLRWLDTPESWQWMLECWKVIYRAAHVTAGDRILFPFSFGPFLGFWTAFDAGSQLGATCIPAGGMSSSARLRLLEATCPTVVCCTPTYALRLAEVAEEEGIKLAGSSVRVLIVAGEPGGSIAATRERIESSWGARLMDHHGLTELGPISFEDWDAPGSLVLIEDEYIGETLAQDGDTPVEDGEIGELVVTNLGRAGSPLIRYRTGDLVRMRTESPSKGRTGARLDGGILARADQMITVRGANVYPAALEEVVRRHAEVVEYRATVTAPNPMRELRIEVELRSGASSDALTRALGNALSETLGLNVPIAIAAPGSLPRFEMKAKRFVVEGSQAVIHPRAPGPTA